MEKRKMMVIIAGMLVALGGVGQFSFAQAAEEGRPGQMSGQGSMQPARGVNRLERISRELNLTEAQKSQVKPILEDEENQLKALRTNTSLSREQQREKAREIRQATWEKIKPLLTPEQLKKREEMMAKGRERLEKRLRQAPQGGKQ